jgi:hypothetical protein
MGKPAEACCGHSGCFFSSAEEPTNVSGWFVLNDRQQIKLVGLKKSGKTGFQRRTSVLSRYECFGWEELEYRAGRKPGLGARPGLRPGRFKTQFRPSQPTSLSTLSQNGLVHPGLI